VAAFESFIALLLGAVVLAAVARRLRAPYPSFLAIGGVVLAFVPGAPEIVLQPTRAYDRLHRTAVAPARRTLLAMRVDNEIGDDAFHEIERELDWLALSATSE
jgi:hypothetical protein